MPSIWPGFALMSWRSGGDHTNSCSCGRKCSWSSGFRTAQGWGRPLWAQACCVRTSVCGLSESQEDGTSLLSYLNVRHFKMILFHWIVQLGKLFAIKIKYVKILLHIFAQELRQRINTKWIKVLRHVCLAQAPWTATRQAPLSSRISGVCSNSCPLSQWCHPATSSSVTPFASNLSQHQGHFQWISSSYQAAKVLELQQMEGPICMTC